MNTPTPPRSGVHQTPQDFRPHKLPLQPLRNPRRGDHQTPQTLRPHELPPQTLRKPTRNLSSSDDDKDKDLKGTDNSGRNNLRFNSPDAAEWLAAQDVKRATPTCTSEWSCDKLFAITFVNLQHVCSQRCVPSREYHNIEGQLIQEMSRLDTLYNTPAFQDRAPKVDCVG